MAEQSGDAHDLRSILCSSDRDFLIRNTGDQVKVDDLKGKKIGIYFSASWCGPCQRFTPNLVTVYNELLPKGNFEVVFVSADEDEESFKEYFGKMPWTAVPFSDTATRKKLDDLFNVRGIPHLVILDESGKRVKEIKDAEDAAKREQSLKTVLVSTSRDYVIAADGKKVPVDDLEGKTVGLYFSMATYGGCSDFTPKLREVYQELKEKNANFEIVMIPLDDDVESFKEAFESLPWFSVPLGDRSCDKLVRYFELSSLPTLVIIGPDGKTLQSNVAEAVEEHGALVYPFTPEKFAEVEEIEKAKKEKQTLESILVKGEADFVIGKDGVKIPVSDLVGKNILLYFSSHWCPPCRAFLPKLVEAYHKIKAKDDAFEVIFISSDRDQFSFDEFFSKMPWLAIPFGDDRKGSLSRLFKVRGIPMLVAIGRTGRTLTTEARNLVMSHGADAYPFTEERLKELEAEYEEMAKGWPKKVNHPLHEEHELLLTRRHHYNCDGCNDGGQGNFEVVFVSADEDEESFKEYFGKMPWTAVPFSDTATRKKLDDLFNVRGIPHLVILDESGKRVKEIKDAAKREQSLKTVLVSTSRDYVIVADGKKVPVDALEGKTVGLYFSVATYGGCFDFTPKLREVYQELKEKNANFEIVMIPLDDDEESFKEAFESLPWFSVPLGDRSSVEEHGALVYPFTPEKFAEVEEIEKAKKEKQTLESILVKGEADFVIGKDGVKIPVSDLVGKNILLYFSAHWCPPCRAFLPKLVEAYHKIKAKDDAFEVIFISSDRDQSSFDEFFSKMPWLAIPFGDDRKGSLSRLFKVRGIPMLVAIGRTSRTLNFKVAFRKEFIIHCY
nr:probable nucleoredoxin 1 [Ipomoea batatas]